MKAVCRTESGPVHAQHWFGGKGGEKCALA